MRFNPVKRHAQTRPHSYPMVVDRADVLHLVNLSDCEYDSSECDTSDDEDEVLGHLPIGPVNSLRLATKKVPRIQKDLSPKSEKTLQQTMLARGVTMPLMKKRLQAFPNTGKNLLGPKMNEKPDELRSLRKGDSMLLSKKRVPKCIHEDNGHNALW